MKPNYIVPNNIKQLRKALRLSLDGVAEAMGIRKSSVWSLEQGRSYPMLDTAYKMTSKSQLKREIVQR